MFPHHTLINIVGTTYLYNLDIFKVVYIDMNQMLIPFV